MRCSLCSTSNKSCHRLCIVYLILLKYTSLSYKNILPAPSMKSEKREETMWRRTVLMDSWVLAGLIFDRNTVHAAKNIPLFRMIPTFNETTTTKRLLCCIDYVCIVYWAMDSTHTYFVFKNGMSLLEIANDSFIRNWTVMVTR